VACLTSDQSVHICAPPSFKIHFNIILPYTPLNPNRFLLFRYFDESDVRVCIIKYNKIVETNKGNETEREG
jgi:hypothetical protein